MLPQRLPQGTGDAGSGPPGIAGAGPAACSLAAPAHVRETPAGPATARLLPTVRGWRTPGFRGLTAMLPGGLAVGRSGSEALSGPQATAARSRFPTGHRRWCPGTSWAGWAEVQPTLLGHGPMPELTTLWGSGLSGGQQQPRRMASVGDMDAAPHTEASPRAGEPRQAGGRAGLAGGGEGRAGGADPSTLHPEMPALHRRLEVRPGACQGGPVGVCGQE